MITEYKYITFLPNKNKWICRNWKLGENLGYIRYYARWKEWEFLPEDGMAFTVDCVRDIAHFLDQLNAGGKT